jgi:hypothetical protein
MNWPAFLSIFLPVWAGVVAAGLTLFVAYGVFDVYVLAGTREWANLAREAAASEAREAAAFQSRILEELQLDVQKLFHRG